MSIEDEARAEAHRRYPIFESDDLPLPRVIMDRALTERSCIPGGRRVGVTTGVPS